LCCLYAFRKGGVDKTVPFQIKLSYAARHRWCPCKTVVVRVHNMHRAKQKPNTPTIALCHRSCFCIGCCAKGKARSSGAALPIIGVTSRCHCWQLKPRTGCVSSGGASCSDKSHQHEGNN
jgi:hypothetical protein